jgi:hypothetical protein
MPELDVAPHGLLFMAGVALLIVLLVHLLGFRIVGAIKVGG